jgi:hypothetical protein
VEQKDVVAEDILKHCIKSWSKGIEAVKLLTPVARDRDIGGEPSPQTMVTVLAPEAEARTSVVAARDALAPIDTTREALHVIEDHPRARESVYFNAQDPKARVQLVCSLGVRRGGSGESLLALRTPDNAATLRPVFQKGMEIQDSDVRMTCIQALSDKTTAADIEALRSAAFDKSKEVRLAAIAALASTRLVEAMDALANMFGDPDMEVRAKALEALGSIPAGDAKKQKLTYLKDFIEVPNQPEALKKRAQELQKQL